MTQIRPATLQHAESIRSCVRDAYAMYVPRMDQEPAPMLADYRSLIERGIVHVMRDGDAVSGLIVTIPDEKGLFVENVAVHPAYQGKGLGKKLMAFAERQARDHGLDNVYLYTNEVMTENLTFYSRLGFTETHRVTEAGYSRVYLRKEVSQNRT